MGRANGPAMRLWESNAMEHRAIKYRVVEGGTPGTWKWTVKAARLRSGKAELRATAIAEATRTIDELLAAKPSRLRTAETQTITKPQKSAGGLVRIIRAEVVRRNRRFNAYITVVPDGWKAITDGRDPILAEEIDRIGKRIALKYDLRPFRAEHP
jgi:hypothetical protein